MRGGGHLRGGGGDLAHLPLLLLHRRQCALRLAAEQLYGAAEALAFPIDAPQRAAQLGDRGIQRGGNTRQIVCAMHLHVHAQVAVTQALRGGDDAGGAAPDRGIQAQQHVERQQGQHAEHGDHLPHFALRLLAVVAHAQGELLV
ncbi:hypothetical protein D3C78_1480950 [compost metagenome]